MKVFKFLKKRKIEILIVLLFVLSRTPNLGHDVFNTDVFKWKSRIYDFGTGVFTLDFERTIQKYHPGVTLLWIGTFAVKAFNFYHEIFLGAPPADNSIEMVFALHAVQKFFIVGVLGFMMALIYYPLNKLFSKKYALIAVSLISLEPFYVALTRVVHLEGMMSTFMIASFIWLYYYLQHKKSRYLIISAIFSSLAILTKTSSFFMVPFVFLVLFIDTYKKENSFKHLAVVFQSRFLPWLLFVIFGFVALWPAMYTHAGEALSALYRGIFTIGVERDHPQLFLGKWVDDPGWYFYLVVFFVRSSLVLIFGLIGLSYLLKKISKDEKKKWFLLYSLLFIFFYVLELSIPSKKLDRYILPAIMSAILMASFFYEYFFEYLQRKIRINFWVLFSTLLGISCAVLIYLHPNYLSYYSPLTGGLKKGMYIIEPKWIFGQKELAGFLKEQNKSTNYKLFPAGESLDDYINKKELYSMFTVALQEKYYTQMWPFIEEIGGRATIKNIVIHAQRSNFFVYPVYEDDSALEDRIKLEYVGSVSLRGVDIYNVYKRVDTQK